MQGLGDLRTEYVKKQGTSASAQEKGRALLLKSIEELGGIKRWKQLRERAIKVTFRHHWYNTMLRTFFMPLEFSGQELELLVRPKQSNVRLTFLDGKWKGTSWGIQQWVTYQVDAKGKLTWKQDKTIKFHLPSFQYFFFTPFYLAEAPLVTYEGERELHGNTYDLIYATWGKWTPQEEVDQYMMWINRKTLLVDFVQSTVRDMFKRSIVTLYLSKHESVFGVKVPFRQSVLQDIHNLKVIMHGITLSKVEQAKGDASKLLIPDPRRKATKQ